jgi:hypothetical protein
MNYPSLPEQGKNLAKFTFEVVKEALTTNNIFVSSEVKKERLAICASCEYYDSRQVRCKHCGCFLEHKTNFALDSCPIDKWSISDGISLDGPMFPSNPKIGDVHDQWQWNGELWDLIQE